MKYNKCRKKAGTFAFCHAAAKRAAWEVTLNTPYIIQIQKFSVHDGPGIRSTVFFKGCPLRCRWCHNPESQNPEPEYMTEPDGHSAQVGRAYSVPELVRLLAKDQIFYEQSGGGVTLSGGEVMIQDMDYVAGLLNGLRQAGISTAIDTCGCAPREHFERVLPCTDLFLYDLKMMDPDRHREYTGTSNDIILKNLKYLSEQGAVIDLRLIMVGDLNMDPDSLRKIAGFLKAENIRPQRISLLPYHDFGRDKYAKLGRECTQNFRKPTEDEMKAAKEFFLQSGYSVSIGG